MKKKPKKKVELKPARCCYWCRFVVVWNGLHGEFIDSCKKHPELYPNFTLTCRDFERQKVSK